MFIIKYLLLTIFSLRVSYALPVIDSESFFSNAAYISSPSIYSYTIENQIPYKQQNFTHQQQKQQPYAAAANYRNEAAYKSNNDYNNYNNNNNNNNYNYNNFNRDLKKVNGYPAMTTSALGTTTTNPNSLLSTQSAPISDCTLDRLAVYKVVLHTYWTRELFPKHYPDWRPTAQWTKTIGRTHDTLYALYHIGQQATSGIKQFAETGKSDILDSALGEQQQQQQHASNIKFAEHKTTSDLNLSSAAAVSSIERSIFDEFNLPPILTGAGRSEAKFFVDSNHSLVSLMTRIVPSPDWFIGVDSFQLCVGGSWIDTVTIEMDPLDAGTDNGFTFTAPNWPTSPQGVIYRVTSRYPAHPAGSFFYPKSKRLPPIATFQFIKLKEYELSEVFNFAEDDRKYETVQTQTHLEMEHNHVEMNNELSATIERERQNEITPQPTHVTEKDRIRSQLLAKMNPMNNSTVQMALGVVPKNDKQAIMQSIANSYRRASETKLTNLSGTFNKKIVKHRRAKRTRDCRVSHWSEWSDCSKSCGIGEMHRYRQVIKYGKRGGRPCPPLKQSKLCGSEQGCHAAADNYFNWSDS